MSLDDLDLTTFRNPTEYLAWFDAVRAAVDDDPTNTEAALLHKGDHKYFFEEMFPLACLLNAEKQNWPTACFRHVKGSQNFDVEVEGLPLHYLEIVTTVFDDAERYRMQRYLEEGSIDALNPVQCNERNRPIGIVNEGEMRNHKDIIQEELNIIRMRILAKSDKQYPEATGLLVYYNDYKCYPTESDRPAFEALIDELTPAWSQSFDTLFIVGAKSDYTFERIIQTTPTHV
jgi:hypothetical protein